MSTRNLAILFPSQEVGGAERYVQTVARAAQQHGWRVEARFPATAELDGLRDELSREGIGTGPLAAGPPSRPGALAAATHALRELLSAWTALARVRPRATLLMLPHPDQSPGLVLGAALFPGRSVAVVQLVPDALEMSRSRQRLYRLARALGQRWIAVSEDNAERLAAGLGWPRAAITLVYNGVSVVEDTEPGRDAARTAVRAGLGLPAGAPMLLSVGRLSWQKGHDVLIEAIAATAAARPDARWVWAGDGEDRAQLERALAEAGLSPRVRLLGNRDDIAELLLAADVFVLPSRSEGMPFALLEAMAAGTPVIATALAAIRELVDDGVHGSLVPVEDPPALAAAMAAALADPARMRSQAQAAQARVRERHSSQAMVQGALTALAR